MARNLGEGVSRDLTSEMGLYENSDMRTQEEIDEKERLAGKGSGFESGDKIVTRTETNNRGYSTKITEKRRGEVRYRTPEAQSKEPTPLEALLAKEETVENDEVMPDDVQEVVGPSGEEDDSSLDDSLEDTSFDAVLPEINTLEQPKSTVAFKDEPKDVGVRRAAANGKPRRIDSRNAEKGISAKELGQNHRDLEIVAGFERQDKMDEHETKVYLKNLDKDGNPPAHIEGKTLLQRIKRMFGGE